MAHPSTQDRKQLKRSVPPDYRGISVSFSMSKFLEARRAWFFQFRPLSFVTLSSNLVMHEKLRRSSHKTCENHQAFGTFLCSASYSVRKACTFHAPTVVLLQMPTSLQKQWNDFKRGTADPRETAE